MRKVISSHHVSLDGFIEGPNGGRDWAVVDDGLHRRFDDPESTIDAHLYGRRAYETMAAYQPTADQNLSAPKYEIEYARISQNKPKIDFSKTLEEVQWNSRLLGSHVGEESAKRGGTPARTCSWPVPILLRLSFSSA